MSGVIESTSPGPRPSLAASKPPTDLRTLGPWYAAEFLGSYSCTLLTAACYDYAHDVLHASPSAALWLSASWGFAYIFIALFAGRLSERWGPRTSVLRMFAACIATCLLGLLAISIPSIWTLLLVMLPYNITSTTIWPAIESAISRTQGKLRLSARMTLYNLSWGSAGFAAFFTRGALEHIHWSAIFIVPAITSALAWLILFRWGVPAHMIGKDHVPDDAAGEHDLDTPGMRKRAQTFLLMAWIGNALAYVAIYVVIPLLARLAGLAGSGTLTGSGMITSVWSLTRFIGFLIVWFWSGWHYKARWLIGAQLLLAASFCLMLIIHNPAMLILTQILFGFSTALIYSSALYYAMHVSDGHGGHAGMHEALIGLGVAIGPAVGALAATGELGLEAMQRISFGVTSVLILGTLVMAWMALRNPRVKGPA